MLLKSLVVVSSLFFMVISGVAKEDSFMLKIEGELPQGAARFNLGEIMQLPATTFEKKNRWTKKANSYTGVLLKDLFVSLGLDPRDGLVEVTAGDDYKAVIRMGDIYAYDYLLCYRKNDKLYSELPVKENRGPLTIVINFDKHKELDFEIYKHHQVWFVEKILVK